MQIHYSKFYHGYFKNQKNAAIIILRYTTLRHTGLRELIHVSSFDTMKINLCIEVQNHVNYM